MTESKRTIKGNAGTLEVTVKRSRRRTVALRVEPSGAITVYAPYFVWGPFIDHFVRKHTASILKKLDYFKDLAQHTPPREFVRGETVPVWGQDVLLENVLPADTLTLNDARSRHAALLDWYARQTEEKLPVAVARYAETMGVSPARVKVANQRSRWGSCSSRGDLRFSWRLAMLPETILEYVVVHELAHLKVMNHSPRFWAVVNAALPDGPQRRAWLRKNARHLAL